MRLGLAAIAVLLVAGCAAGSSSADGPGFVSGSGTVDFQPEEREVAPDVEAETLEGERLALSDLEGVVVLNFWASWCGPCAAEASDLVATHEAYAEQGVHLVGVNVRDSIANARSFERDFEVPYPSLFDEDSRIASRFGGIGPSALPTTILVDDQGRVASRLFGAVTAPQLARRIDALLEERDQADAGGPAAGVAGGGSSAARPRGRAVGLAGGDLGDAPGAGVALVRPGDVTGAVG